MSSPFFQVFPELNLGQRLSDLFERVTIDQVTAEKTGQYLKIYMTSDCLIQRRDIHQVEREIHKQFFTDQQIEILLIEHYRLPAVYTPQVLFEQYEQSLEDELGEESAVEADIFHRCKKEFVNTECLLLTAENDLVTASRMGKIQEKLTEIFRERFDQSLQVQISLTARKEGMRQKRADETMEREVKQIVKDYESAQGKEKQQADREESRRSDEGNGMSFQEGRGKFSSVLGENHKQEDSSEKQGMSGQQEKNGKKSNRGREGYRVHKLEDPDIFYGKAFEGETTPISEIYDEIGDVIVRGQVFTFTKDDQVQTREIRNERTLVIFKLTDFTDTIKVKLFVKNDVLPTVLSYVKPDAFLKIKGVAMYDKYDHEITIGSVSGMKTILDFREKRMDHCSLKRVELHAHTTMSEMDSVADVKKLVKTAASWGHSAIAITDHGVVQAFPDANHAVEELDKEYRKEYEKAHPQATKEELAAVQNPFKVLYGCEAYLVDDLKPIVENGHGESLRSDFVVFDIETTGLSYISDQIIEIGAVKVHDGQIVDHFSTFVNPQRPIPPEIEKLTGIRNEMVEDADNIEVILPRFLNFCEGCIMVAHNAEFDMSFIQHSCEQMGLEQGFVTVDTLGIARALLPDLKNYKLDTVTEAMGCVLKDHHRAVNDAEATADVFVKFIERLHEQNVDDLDALNEMSHMSVKAIQKARSSHGIILVQNETGRVNLYRLVSQAHLTYYNRWPRIPKSLLNQYREGLIVGSACSAGDLYRAIVEDRPQQEIARIVKFYDYLEIQPIGNNRFMIGDPKYPHIQSEDDLRAINRRIVNLGEQFHKPVCATGDVHFIDPEDELYRRTIMFGKGFEDADRQPPLYLHTTQEMLDEFSYLGAEKAEEVVVTNPNRIADQIEKISPVSPDKCPPVIENSDENLRNICYERAHEIYGEKLPKIVEDRLEKELNSIISNGFAVMYIIAQKLVWKSVSDGYLVGSRGSVGSSFAAYTAGITEVNSLPAHYLCPNCKYVDFDSDYVKSFSGRSGCDMEDRVCPVCGQPLSKEGHDIPFETFLGFKGNKEPDIDLNFSGEYQSKAHAYTEVIFGYGQTFRAGTVGGLADKTAYGYALHYCEEHGLHKRSCEIERMSKGCIGVRRTSGQHPGGIVVLPRGMEIYTFTPVQHPANDMKTNIVTTHFDYHSIDHNLLKLDILGHDDPTMIRMLEDLTGVEATKIHFDDPDVLSLFRGLDALDIVPEDIGGTELGSLGIPEFGTDFAMQMLKETKPTGFSDLARIAGLAHGTDVWLGNAQTLIEEGKATISTAICTRDDIMIYLIHQGMEPELSFKIMESVRKGKGLTPEWEEAMKEHDVPDWYIWSCKKIKYMFPKAHAVAYVMMGFRIAWFKIHEPLAFYASFFSIRATSFDYELMCQGKEAVDEHIKEYKANPKLTQKEEGTLRDMRIVQEMYARGFTFLPVDLYRSAATKFLIEDGKLRPPFSSIEGVAAAAGEQLYEAGKEGPYISRDEIKQRSGVGTAVIEALARAEVLEGLPESDQLSFFDGM